ncbi:MAG: TIGR04283 family arsenosugar biosynthesis glycosyltransferase [Gemmatimonadota bacterium]|nr:TIGR04283 family arsenosugar biosynthesis glycosyltransferase [Gemmatimonadota bacterium]
MSDPHVRFSAVIPTLDEAREIAETLSRASRALGPEAELIVVDGGSEDRTLEIARRYGTVLETGAGRGRQLATGAEAARGDILVFLHADTWLPPGTGATIERAIRRGAEVGCLRMGFRDGALARYRLLAAAINARTRLFRTATGDQAIFATREAYRSSGGIQPVPMFEDVRFVRAARRSGAFRLLPLTAQTSPRRWEAHGFLRTVGLHLWLRLRHALGASPETLAARYRRG